MRHSMLTLAAALALSVSASAASASVFLFQWDDGETALTGNTYQDGLLIQHVVVGQETYGAGYGLWNLAVMTQNVDVSVNILDASGSLSDTWRIAGAVGDRRLVFPFNSDNGSTLQPLPGAVNLVENGDWQTVTEFDVSTGDHYIWQFRSDVDVPEPATWAMMIAGFGMIGIAARRRKALVAQTA